MVIPRFLGRRRRIIVPRVMTGVIAGVILNQRGGGRVGQWSGGDRCLQAIWSRQRPKGQFQHGRRALYTLPPPDCAAAVQGRRFHRNLCCRCGVCATSRGKVSVQVVDQFGHSTKRMSSAVRRNSCCGGFSRISIVPGASPPSVDLTISRSHSALRNGKSSFSTDAATRRR